MTNNAPQPASPTGPTGPSGKTLVSEEGKPPSMWEVAKNIEIRELAPSNVARLPCARSALLLGITTGVVVGTLRYIRSGSFRIAGNWAVPLFALTSVGSWELCRLQRRKSQQALHEYEIVPGPSIPKA